MMTTRCRIWSVMVLVATPCLFFACSSDDSDSSGGSGQSCDTVDPNRQCGSPTYTCSGDRITIRCSDGFSCYMDCKKVCSDMGGTYVSCGTQAGSEHDQCLCQQ